MANPYAITPANPLQALMMGVQGYDQGQKSQQAQALQEAGQLYAAGDIKGAQAAAARGGSLQALMGFAGLQNQDRDYNRAVSNDARSQTNADRGFGLQEKQINATIGGAAASRDLARQQFDFQKEQGNRPDVREVTDANGNKTLVLVDRKGQSATPINTGIQPSVGNPYAPSGKFNETQGKAATFADRMSASHGILTTLEGTNKGSGAIGGVMANSSIPGVGGDSTLFNSMSSDDRQKFMQSQRDFINAILRRESGAAISQSEFENAKRQYFPQPGDSDAVIEQKRQNRVLSIEGNMREAGPAYRPPEGWGGPGKSSPVIAPPEAAVNALKADPSRRAEFDKKFGVGASRKILGQ